jgi:polysaccharide pyruvyl transferase CsaB
VPLFQALRNTKASPRLVLIGNFGAGNVGDELILAGFLKKLKSRLPKARVTVLAANPTLASKWHKVNILPLLPCGFRSFFRGGWRASLKKIKEADAVVFPGGGLFTDHESWRAVTIWGWQILIARYYWKPVYLLGQSVGPFRNKLVKKLAKRALEKAEWIGVRDNASAQELTALGMPKNKIKLGEDSARWLADKIPTVGAGRDRPAYGRDRSRPGRQKILVSVRLYPKVSDDFYSELAAALDKLSEKKPVRISFASFGNGDDKAWKKVRSFGKHKKLWKTIKLPSNPEEVLRTIKGFDLVIGMRLHSNIVANLVGVPSIALSYANKVSALRNRTPVLSVKNFKAAELLRLLNIKHGT